VSSWRPAQPDGCHGETAAETHLEWLVDVGFWDQRPQDLPDPSMMNAAQPILAREAAARGLSVAGAPLGANAVASLSVPLDLCSDETPAGSDGTGTSCGDTRPNIAASNHAFAARLCERFMDAATFQRHHWTAHALSSRMTRTRPVDLHPPTTLSTPARNQDIRKRVLWCSNRPLFTG
jgi:hypothetical protein